MGASFFGFNIATQGLYVARGALDVTNHNISNVETKGYSRQEIIQTASRPLATNTGTGMIGTGAEITDILRIREEYLDDKFLSANASAGQYDIKETSMKELEMVFNEPSDAGFNTSINDLFKSLQDLSKNPGDDSYKTAAVGKLDTFAKYFNTVAGKLQDFQGNINSQIETKVNQINNIGIQVKQLNRQISSLEFRGDTANDLRDHRDLLIDDLSRLVNTETKEVTLNNGIKEFKVKINGETFVDNDTVKKLEIVAREDKSNPEDIQGLYEIKWETGQIFNTDKPEFEGELKGYLDIRDGNNNMNLAGNVKGMLQEPGSSKKFQITIGNPSRDDIIESGEVTINNKIFEYDSFEIEEDGDILLRGVSPDPRTDVSEGDEVGASESKTYKGIPYYVNKLNEFVRTFAKEFNEIHKKGETKAEETNTNLFTYDGYTDDALDENDASTYNEITAYNFGVSKDILNNVDNLATSYNKNNGESDNDLINNLISIKQESRAFDNDKPSTYMELVIAQAGIDTTKCKSFNTNKENMVHSIQNQRLSNSGVDLNEEAQNMIKYQQAYNVAAKMMSVMNQIYDVTINQMGI